MADLPQDFTQFTARVEQQLNHMLYALFGKLVPQNADAFLEDCLRENPGFRNITDTRFMLKVFIQKWNLWASKFHHNYNESKKRLDNVSQLLNLSKHLPGASEVTWDDIDAMVNDLGWVLRMLNKPIDPNVRINITGLSEEFQTMWERLPKDGVGPSLRPVMRLEEIPSKSGMSGGSISLRLRDIAENTELIEDLKGYISSELGFDVQCSVNGSDVIIPCSSTQQRTEIKDMITSNFETLQVEFNETAHGFVIYGAGTLDPNQALMKVKEHPSFKKDVASKLVDMEFVQESNEIVAITTESVKFNIQKLMGLPVEVVPFSPYRLKISNIPIEANRAQLEKLISSVVPSGWKLYFQPEAHPKTAVVWTDSAEVFQQLKTRSFLVESLSNSALQTAASTVSTQVKTTRLVKLKGELKATRSAAYALKHILDLPKEPESFIAGARGYAIIPSDSVARCSVQRKITAEYFGKKYKFEVEVMPPNIFCPGKPSIILYLKQHCQEKINEAAEKENVIIQIDDDTLATVRPKNGIEDDNFMTSCNRLQSFIESLVSDLSSEKVEITGLLKNHYKALELEIISLQNQFAPVVIFSKHKKGESDQISVTLFVTYPAAQKIPAAQTLSVLQNAKACSRKVKVKGDQKNAIHSISASSIAARFNCVVTIEGDNFIVHGILPGSVDSAAEAIQSELNKIAFTTVLKKEPAIVFWAHTYGPELEKMIATDAKIRYNPRMGVISIAGPEDSVKKAAQTLDNYLHSILCTPVGPTLDKNTWQRLMQHPNMGQALASSCNLKHENILPYLHIISAKPVQPSNTALQPEQIDAHGRDSPRRGVSSPSGTSRGRGRGQRDNDHHCPDRGRGRGRGRGGGHTRGTEHDSTSPDSGRGRGRGRGQENTPKGRKRKGKVRRNEMASLYIVSNSKDAIMKAQLWLDDLFKNVITVDIYKEWKPSEAKFMRRTLLNAAKKRHLALNAARGPKPLSITMPSGIQTPMESDDESSSSDDLESDIGSEVGSEAGSDDGRFDDETEVEMLLRSLDWEEKYNILLTYHNADGAPCLLVSGLSEDVQTFISDFNAHVMRTLFREKKTMSFKKVEFRYLTMLRRDDLLELQSRLQLKIHYEAPKRHDNEPKRSSIPKNTSKQYIISLYGRRKDVQEGEKAINDMVKGLISYVISIPFEEAQLKCQYLKLIETRLQHEEVGMILPGKHLLKNLPLQSIDVVVFGADQSAVDRYRDEIASVKIKKDKTLLRGPEAEACKKLLLGSEMKNWIASNYLFVDYEKLNRQNLVEVIGPEESVELLFTTIKASTQNEIRSVTIDPLVAPIVKHKLDELKPIVRQINRQARVSDRMNNNVLCISAPKSAIEECYKAVLQKVQEWKSSMISKVITLKSSLPVAAFAKERLAKIARQSGVSLTLPFQHAILASYSLGSLTVEVVHGNIINQRADAIVSAANCKLQNAGGVAQVIESAAGPQYAAFCQRLAEQSSFSEGSALATEAFNLKSNFKFIIHGFGPRWPTDASAQGHAIQVLKNTYNAVFREANDRHVASIVTPLISSNIFGFPSSEAAKALVDAVKEWAERSSTITLIRICDIREKILREVVREFDGSFNRIDESWNTVVPDIVAIQYVWEWQENDGSFIQFDPDQNSQIEIAYLKWQSGEGASGLEVTGDLNMQKNGYKYWIDFTDMTELNTYYKRNKRKIRRLPMRDDQRAAYGAAIVTHNTGNTTIKSASSTDLSASSNALAAQPANTTHARPASELQQDQVEIRGLPDAVKQAKRKLLKFAAENVSETTLKTGNQITKAMEADIKNIATRNYAICTIDPQNGTITICTTNMRLSTVELEIERLIRSRAQDNRAPPPTWEPQTASIELKSVKQGTKEWGLVENRIKETIPNATISRIERVQNQIIWQKYVNRRDELITKYGKEYNQETMEMRLWHGTRNNPPSVIYENEFGFDMRYSNVGMWGTGLYFAYNASYSNNYCYVVPNTGEKQMFLARVLVGNAYDCPSNSNLRKPPVLRPATAGVPSLDYDSVSGQTGGSKVYIIYENGKAYPEYLVTFRG